MGENFFETRDDRCLQKIAELCSVLPEYVTEFVVGIQMRTSALTRLGYVTDIKIFFEYLLTHKWRQLKDFRDISLALLSEVKAYDIELYLGYLTSYSSNGKRHRCGNHSKERKLCALRTFFKYLYKKDKLPEDVTKKVDSPKVHTKPILYLEIDEIVKLLDMVEDNTLPGSVRQRTYAKKTRDRDLAILTLFLGTGIRISECVGLDLDDLDMEKNALRITRKGGNKSILYFSDEVRGAVLPYLRWRSEQANTDTPVGKTIRQTPAVFVSLQGKRMSVRTVELLVKKYTGAVTPLKKITPHKLRSTYGTTLYRETQDIYVVADVLGHRDINTTKKHYAAISDEIRRGAARAVKLRDKPDET